MASRPQPAKANAPSPAPATAEPLRKSRGGLILIMDSIRGTERYLVMLAKVPGVLSYHECHSE